MVNVYGLVAIIFTALIAFFIGRRSRNNEVTAAENRAFTDRVRRKQIEDEFLPLVQTLREDSVLLPSIVHWADAIQEAYDEGWEGWLRSKKPPAKKAAEHVKEARQQARAARKEMEIVINRLNLYETLAPWLSEYVDLSLKDLLEAMREEEETSAAIERGEDPVSRFIPKAEWVKLSTAERNQLALERYCNPSRKCSLWSVGVQYERYIGYQYETEGYSVQYQGAIKGREDLGVDLVCENETEIAIVQCKRLSIKKEIPVRENAIAQIYGSAELHRLRSQATKAVRPVLITTYRLSEEARRFAEHLGVEVREFHEFKAYPMIKCNISAVDGSKIYHLPMDQQYDKVVVGNHPGEFYASTAAEAEAAGFRRAFRWRSPSTE